LQHIIRGAQPSLNRNYISPLSIRIPVRADQDLIVELLGSLDDKIELNRRMNETLEAMAQAIFRDWFVNFGPTRRKLAGLTDPIEIMGGLTKTTRAAELATLFPPTLADNGVPEGWRERPLDEIATFLNGLALQKFPATNLDSLPVIKIAQLRSGNLENANQASRELPSKYIIQNGDFLFSWSGSLLAKFWTRGEGALNQHLFKVTSETYPMWFVTRWVHHHMAEFQQIAASKATTMGHIQRAHLHAAKTICPPDRSLVEMGELLEPIVTKIVNNEFENANLASTRELLLPKLMSGEIRLRDALQQAEANT
jgi:type I restriction enzyme, S subunit